MRSIDISLLRLFCNIYTSCSIAQTSSVAQRAPDYRVDRAMWDTVQSRRPVSDKMTIHRDDNPLQPTAFASSFIVRKPMRFFTAHALSRTSPRDRQVTRKHSIICVADGWGKRVRIAAATAVAAATALLTPIGSLQAAQKPRPSQLSAAIETKSVLRSMRGGKAVYVASAGGSSPGSFKVAACAALVASSAATLLCHPIDTLKTMKQAQSMNLNPVSPDTGAAGNSPDCVEPFKLASSGDLSGFARLYRGVLSNVLKEAPNAAVYLGCYELFKTWLLTWGGPFAAFPLLAYCIAGMGGDAVGSVVRVPAEVLNKRLQLGLSANWNDAVRDAFMSSAGVQLTIASWKAILWRDVPYGGIQIALYEFFRNIMRQLFRGGGILVDIVAGAVAGLVAAIATTPADVLVTRMAAQNPQCYLETRKFMSPVATFKRVYAEEGVRGVWNGAWERGFYYAPLVGVFFACYEVAKFILMRPRVLLASVNSSVLGAIGLTVSLAVFIARNYSRLFRLGQTVTFNFVRLSSMLRKKLVRNN